MMDVLISTARLYFRQFREGDEQKLFDLNSDEEVVKFTGNASMKDLAEAHDVLVNIILPQYSMGFGRWAVYRKEDDAFLGWCGLKKVDDHNIDLGYRFFRKYWGKGYASEAAITALEYGFNKLNIDKVVAHAMVENKNSIKILDKFLQRTKIIKEENKDVQCFEMTREMFLEKLRVES
ncbi:GNAT family N-acetyltransferase [Pinibacter soli]|uniref:GNAT family N-acetyltransferase n=1 Tax=Pinibacter soli TaxID=3044211 RepID=A0ABT6RAN0_9BACT|nr:GNAT family N-acetyltransferase [Pinibacter soli]MDI3319610.1 GNAT family N-acetyltransferase [Pinibacter soli]